MVSPSYILSPNDQVQIEVFQEDELRTTALITSEGTIAVPLVGTVKISGMSQSQARDRIAQLLKADYLVNPQVSLSVVRFSRKRFIVLGQVQRPGTYDLPDQEKIDLVEAIAMAGGYTNKANPAKITIKRRANGGEQIFRVDAKKLAKQSTGDSSFSILQGDTITVAESIF